MHIEQAAAKSFLIEFDQHTPNITNKIISSQMFALESTS